MTALPSDADEWCALPEATPAQRTAWLEELADRGAVDPVVREFALRASHELAAAYPDPAVRMMHAVHYLLMGGHRELWPDACDLYRSARRTLASLRGDCKAWTVLYVAACRAVGARARVRWIPEPGETWDHVCAEATRRASDVWELVEPSLPWARFGEHPHDAARRLLHDHTAG